MTMRNDLFLFLNIQDIKILYALNPSSIVLETVLQRKFKLMK